MADNRIVMMHVIIKFPGLFSKLRFSWFVILYLNAKILFQGCFFDCCRTDRFCCENWFRKIIIGSPTKTNARICFYIILKYKIQKDFIDNQIRCLFLEILDSNYIAIINWIFMYVCVKNGLKRRYLVKT